MGVVIVNCAALIGTLGAAMLILISLLLTALPFTAGFIIGIVLSRKRGR